MWEARFPPLMRPIEKESTTPLSRLALVQYTGQSPRYYLRSIVRFASAAFLLVFFLTNASGHDIITTKLTYTRDISRILARRCLECHSSSASIPLTTYEQVRPGRFPSSSRFYHARCLPGSSQGFGDLVPDNGLNPGILLDHCRVGHRRIAAKAIPRFFRQQKRLPRSQRPLPGRLSAT